MNKKQLIRLGVPEDCVAEAIACLQVAGTSIGRKGERPKRIIPKVAQAPEVYTADDVFGSLAKAILEHRKAESVEYKISYRQWGNDLDEASKQQMNNACSLPISTAAALMPDAHSGYGLPIGGVLACDNAVIPYGVGVDIACRMKMTVTDLPVDVLDQNDKSSCEFFDRSLNHGTVFGTGKTRKSPADHPVLDEDWTITAITRQSFDKARQQLGTSGSGNHFVEWGIVTLPEEDLGLPAGKYVALLSHSGSRGAGAAVCRRYTEIAQRKIPARFRNDKQLRHLAWLSLDEEEGQEYWAAMNLMGRYASANHKVIHDIVIALAGGLALATVENHHNFAWIENHNGQEVVVHRKGATPAGDRELGVIPGNMADSAFVVRGKGCVDSLTSASHGAGRRMSRTKAKQMFNWKNWNEHLRQHNVRLLAGGIDEVPGAYKDIHDVMAAQTDLVDVVGEFKPRIVMMCGDGSRPED